MQVRLLGPVELVDAARPVRIGGNERRVLTALALDAPRRVSEDQLIEVLWGREPPRTARRTLHGYVSRLRRNLGAGEDVRVETVGGGYRLLTTPGAIDVDDVRALVARATEATAGGNVDKAAALLVSAEARWRGRSLGDLADEPFALAAAGRLEELRLDVIEERVTAELAAGRNVALAAELEQLTGQHPLRERLWQARMLALYRNGRQADALRVFQDLRQQLVDEIGIEPSATMRELEAAVLRQDAELLLTPLRPEGSPAGGEPSADAGQPAAEGGRSTPGEARPRRRRDDRRQDPTSGLPLPAALRRPQAVPCIGRQDELARILGVWQRCVAGMPATILVSGAPGVGKTRLAIETAQEVHSQGGIVLYGACDEAMMTPHQPFMEALHHYVRALEPAALPALLGPQGGELARLAPEVATIVPGLWGPTSSEPETERFRLFQAVAGWLRAAAEVAPVLLIIDDLHWAGQATALMLGHLLAHLEDSRVCVMATYRPTDIRRSAHLSATLAGVRRLPGVEQLSVGGLIGSQTEALVQAVVGRDLDDRGRQVAAQVHAETEGNPFFVHEVLRHLAERGALPGHEGDGGGDGPPDGRIGLPDSVREVVQRRLAVLPDETVAVLTVASVIGQEFSLRILDRTVEVEAAFEALEPALEGGLVEDASSDTDLRYRFTHALVQATLYDLPSPARRAQLHGQVALAMEEAFADNLDPLRPALAYHLVAAAPAGLLAEAVEACRQAGLHTLAVPAPEAAAMHFRNGLRLLDPSPGPSVLRAELATGLAEALYRSGDPEYRQALEEAWHIAAELDDPAVAVRASLSCSRGYWSAFNVIDQARVAAVELALARFPGDDHRDRARLLAQLAAELIWDPSAQEHYTAMADEALAMARRLGDRSTLAAVLVLRLGTFWGLRRSDECYRLAVEGLELAVGLGDPVLQVQFATHGILCAVESAAPERLDPLRHLIDQLLPTLGQPFWEYSSHYAIMLYLTIRGDPSALEACMESSLALGERLGLPEAPFMAACELGGVHWWRDTYEEVLDAVALAADLEDMVTMQTWLAAIAAHTGDRDRAQAIVDRFSAVGFDLPPDHSQGIALAECALAAWELGDERAARQLIDRIEPHRELVLCNPINAAGPAERFLAVLYATCGRWAEADGAFAAALATSEAMGARMWPAHIYLDWARTMVGRPDPDASDRSRYLAGLALGAARELGLVGIERRALALGGDTAAAGPSPGPGLGVSELA